MSKLKLKRKKVGDQRYDLVDQKGTPIARAVKTGSHLDDYPWEWFLYDGYRWENPVEGRVIRTGGVTDTLKAIVDYVESAANQYGLTNEKEK